MASSETTSELTSRDLRWIWGGAFVVVALFGYGLTPWETIQVALGAAGDLDRNTLLAFAAGYTLPATVGFTIIVWLLYTRTLAGQNGAAVAVWAALILAGTAVACQELGLGLVADLSQGTYHSGPPYVAIPMYVLTAYFNSYGWGLMVSAAAIGIAAGLHAGVLTGKND